jgi:hypothetical protein
LKFDYTYIVLGRYLIFEPLIIVSNFIFLIISIWGFAKMRAYRNGYARSMGLFMLSIGVSGIFGALCHSIHYQLGVSVFDNLLFCVNVFSLLAAYFCFRGTHLHAKLGKDPDPLVMRGALVWLVAVMIYSFFARYFLVVTIHAGVVLVYSLIVHLNAWRQRREKGSLLVVWGIISSFMSIVVHSLHISFDEWFNHKDFAHVFMIGGMILIGKGAIRNSALHVTASEQSAS